MPETSSFSRKYAEALTPMLGRKLEPRDGAAAFALSRERMLKIKIPIALREYYLVAGRLSLNKEHNRLHSPEELEILEGKLVFMEENQSVVFWGMDLEALDQEDPEVFQASNATPIVWYSEGLPFSDFITKMWRWQHGLDPGQ